MYDLIKELTLNGCELKFSLGNYGMILCAIRKTMSDGVIISLEVAIAPEMLEDSLIPNEMMVKCLWESYEKVKAAAEQHVSV